jgi:hypothetical protein
MDDRSKAQPNGDRTDYHESGDEEERVKSDVLQSRLHGKPPVYLPVPTPHTPERARPKNDRRQGGHNDNFR